MLIFSFDFIIYLRVINEKILFIFFLIFFDHEFFSQQEIIGNKLQIFRNYKQNNITFSVFPKLPKYFLSIFIFFLKMQCSFPMPYYFRQGNLFTITFRVVRASMSINISFSLIEIGEG